VTIAQPITASRHSAMGSLGRRLTAFFR
jgi:hypothetical protein